MVSRVAQTVGLIVASPALLGCGCLLIPVVFIVGAIGLVALTEVVTFLSHNAKPIGITLTIGAIVGVGVILFKRCGEPSGNE